MKKEVIVDIKKLNKFYIAIQLLSMLILMLVRIKLKPVLTLRAKWYMVTYILFIFFIHEVLHGIGFKFIGKAKWEDIKIGFHKKLIAPFCTCKDLVMTKNQYIGVTLLPNIVLSILTLLIMIKSDNLFWSFIAGYVIGSGAGDYYMVIEAMKYPDDARFQDHPTEPGFYIYY